jgi:glycosyltransferase involved in cell wall biosynthesis
MSAILATERRPLRILLLGSVPLAEPWDGADKNLARTLIAADHHNTFLIQTAASADWATMPQVRPIPQRWASPIPTARQKGRAFMFLLRHAHEIDLVHLVASLSHPGWISVSGRLLAAWMRVLGLPLLHTAPSLGDHPLLRRHLPGDLTVVVSEHSRQRLHALGKRHIMRIMPPIDLDRLIPGPDSINLAARLDLGLRSVLYPAHYGPDSGIEAMINALATLPPGLSDTVLVLACRAQRGQDLAAEERRMLQYAQEQDVARRIRVVGQVSAMPALISACSLTALVPVRMRSKMDLPLVLLESLALGRPILISDQEPMVEALLGGGLAVPPGAPDQLSAALITLLGDERQRAAFARRGQDAVLTQCHPAQVVAEYQTLYWQALANYSQRLGRLHWTSSSIPDE